MIIQTQSYPRAALLGNPSDGYYGKTIGFPFRNFLAEVTLYETPELEILPADYDSNVFDSIGELSEDVDFYGYYGGVRLLKAAIKRFYEYSVGKKLKLHNKNFTVRYSSSIPYRLGLAGSSAIITACFKALKQYYGVDIPEYVMAGLVLSVETDELEISAGLQDRVIQAYEAPVYMDFNKDLLESRGYGDYQVLDKSLFYNIYIAYQTDLSEGSEVVHNDFKERYHFGVTEVMDAIREWGEITTKGMAALKSGNRVELNALINQNFDLRNSVMNIGEKNRIMVELARSVGASAKFTGSGGAIIGLYENEKSYNQLKDLMSKNNIATIKPEII
ncbi:mevalonate kinase [Bacteroidota bacterium]